MPAADQQTPRVYWPWAERTGGELSTAAVLKSGWPAGCSTPHSKHLPHHLFFLFSKNYVCCCEYRDRQWIFVYVNHNLITFLNPLMNSNNLSIESLGFSAYKVTSAVSNGSLFFFFPVSIHLHLVSCPLEACIPSSAVLDRGGEDGRHSLPHRENS